MKLEDLYFEYHEKKLENFTYKDMEHLRAELPLVEMAELRSIDDFKLYLELVQKFRQSGEKSLRAALGGNFHTWLTNTLSVGEDGIYADGDSKFLYELIQNVDDCDYDSIEKSCLEIEFNPQADTIILTYNEKGFKPKDVFNVTGIAEKSKNISTDKIEIGEKGIGFKSVFGIADEVLIQSGNFSFALERENFTIPILRYDKFNGIDGTRLTLIIKHKEKDVSHVENIYRNLVNRYNSEASLVNENPILFLNKLTKLKMCVDGFRNILFSVDRSAPEALTDGVLFENSIEIKAELKDSYKGMDKSYNKFIKCYRYQVDCVYDRDACVSRYGEATQFNSKRMKVVAIFPHVQELNKIEEGSLYSFLPTQAKTTAPLIMHAPFNLDGSRDYVNSQNRNEWFDVTANKLVFLIASSFKHLSTHIKEQIIRYLPKEYFFSSDNLQIRELSRERLLQENIFVCSDGKYRMADEICALATEEKINNAIKAHYLANIELPLFNTKNTAGLFGLGVKVYKKTLESIFVRALELENISKEAFDFLMEEGYKPNEEWLKERVSDIKFTNETLKILSNYDDYKRAVCNAVMFIAKSTFDKLPSMAVSSSMLELSYKHRQLINDALGEIERKFRLKEYWERIKGKCYFSKVATGEFCIPMAYSLILFGESPLRVFESFARALGGSRIFEVALTVCDVSEQLDNFCNDNMLDGNAFFDLLKEQRGHLKKSFGSEAYSAYIKIIQDAGVDKSRFLKELIQNADDCEYSDGTTPQFIVKIEKDRIVTKSNERGFTRKNLRAITAIGESTKRRLFGNNAETIGEKGIGFKSVFGIAKSVVIRSCRDNDRFDFSLSCEAPTIPKKESIIDSSHLFGTTMEFALKDNMAVDEIPVDKVIDICRCLRKLRHIEIGGIKVKIEDSDDGLERLITVKDGHLSSNQIRMRIVKHCFDVNDAQALAERTDDYSFEIDKSQSIIVYIPEKFDNRYCCFSIYSGLPTSETINAPLYIDAPFDLVASRERIKLSKWNECVAVESMTAVAKALAEIAVKEHIAVLDYLPKDGNLFNGEFADNSCFALAIKRCEMLPTLCEEYFAVPFSNMQFYPYFVRLLLEKTEIPVVSTKMTIDYFSTLSSNTERLMPVLNYLQCKQADDSIIIGIIEKHASQHLGDKKIREAVYSYLKNIQREQKQSLLDRINQLKIIPIKATDGNAQVFIASSEQIYYGENEKSTSSCKILSTDWLSKDDYNKIFDTYIQEMNDGTRRAVYEKKLDETFRGFDNRKEYEWLKNEFQINQQGMKQSQGWFLQNKHRIPLLRADNCFYYASNSLFKASEGILSEIQGQQLKLFLVSSDSINLADFLHLSTIDRINFSEFSQCDEVSLTREDILDLQNEAIIPHYTGVAILAQCKDAGYISQELILEMDLSVLGNSEIPENHYEFPPKPVSDIFKARGVKNLESPTKIFDKQVTRSERWCKPSEGAEFALNSGSDDYPKHMYSPNIGKNICFCQWCKKPFDMKYMEVNKIEYKSDEYYWDQLKLIFCLNHSKDFKELRNNVAFGIHFIESIINNDTEIDNDGTTVLVRIADKQIAFTATHFAEVQQILKIMKSEEK